VFLDQAQDDGDRGDQTEDDEVGVQEGVLEDLQLLVVDFLVLPVVAERLFAHDHLPALLKL